MKIPLFTFGIAAVIINLAVFFGMHGMLRYSGIVQLAMVGAGAIALAVAGVIHYCDTHIGGPL